MVIGYCTDMAEDTDNEIMDRLRDFASDCRDAHERDIRDFKVSKNVASGNGFTTKGVKNQGWNAERGKVTVNLLEPVIGAIVHEFTSSPFDFKTDAPADLPELKFQLGTCLREACIDGVSYLLTYKENEKIKFLRLNNFNVIYGPCEYADGSDCKEAVYIDKKDYGREGQNKRRKEWDKMFTSVLNLQKNEGVVLTYWRKRDGFVDTFLVENGEITQRTTQEMPRIPLVRIYGKETLLDNERNWRGLYWQVRKILRSMDAKKSFVYERIVTAPNRNFLVAKQSIDNPESWSKINDIPAAYIAYNAIDPNNPSVPLPAPIPLKFDTGILEIEGSIKTDQDLVMSILGASAGTPVSNETAEAVLLRRETKDSAVNEMIKNLLDSAQEIAEIIKALSGGMEVTVQSDIFEKAKKNEDLQKIIALTTLVNNNPAAMTILPAIVAKMDLPLNEQETILKLFLQDKEGNNAASMELQALKAENAQLRANNEANLQAAQMESQSSIETKKIDAIMKDAELKVKMQELHLKETELAMQNNRLEGQLAEEAANNAEKNALAAAKHAEDSEANRIKLAQEATKISNEAEKAVMDIMSK